jgi:cytochrome bd ubiquinol oxidase subunit II
VTLADVPLVILLAGIVAYAVLGGADFGAGLWQVTGGHGAREQRIREHARHALSPVWEANHVWLILVLTVCWTCYPTAFAAIASTLALPLTIAALGIVLRATTYVLRSQTDSLRAHRSVERLFALSSIVVPFTLGAAIGGIASGRVPLGNAQGDLVTSWLNATSVAVGLLAVVSTAYISAVWLAADARREGSDELTEAFRLRALVSAVVAGVIALGGLIVVRQDDDRLWHGLSSWPGAAAVAVSAVAGVVALGLIARRRLEPARVVSVVAVAAVIAGWALAQRPQMLPGLTVQQAAAGRATLVAVLVGLALGSVILIPSLALLFRLVLRGTFAAAAEPRAVPASTRAVRDPGRATALCAVGLVAGALVLVVGDAAWSIAIGAGLLLVTGACGFAIVARSLASSEA